MVGSHRPRHPGMRLGSAVSGKRTIRGVRAVANLSLGGDNHGVVKELTSTADQSSNSVNYAPFSSGALVVVTLANPRDKFWGMVLTLATEGLSISGIELASFDDLAVMVKDGEPFTPAVVFFPMHRVERIELDLPDGGLPSLAQRFQAKTGLLASAVLGSPAGGGKQADGYCDSRLHPGQEAE